MTVFGIDPSVTRLGLARPDGSTCSLAPSAGAADPLRRLNELVSFVARELARWPDAELVVVEGYALHGPGRIALVRLGELGGALRLLAWERLLHVVEVAPDALKLVATGSGRADKTQIVDAAREAGASPRNHDEADAWWLHEIGRRAVAGEPLPASVAALPWPTPTPEAVS